MMNFQNQNLHHGEATRQGPPQFSPNEALDESSQSTVRPSRRSRRHRRNHSLADPSISPQPTTFFHAPSPPSLTESTVEIYGPDRLFGPPLVPGYVAPRPVTHSGVHFDEAQLAMFAADNSARMSMHGIKDELALAAGKVTPGVDDTPYIQYALDALTREGERASLPANPFPVQFGSSDEYPSSSSDDYPQPQRHQGETAGFAPITPPQPAYVEDRIPMARPAPETPETPESPETSESVYVEEDSLPRVMTQVEQPAATEVVQPTVIQVVQPTATAESTPATVVHHHQPEASPPSPSPPSVASEEERWLPVNDYFRQRVDPRGVKYPPLTYKPSILRLPAMTLLLVLIFFMVVGLLFCGIYSNLHEGLTAYPGSIYSGQYFVFRILPQIFAAVILLYSQAVVETSLRILPFTAMASEKPMDRKGALFQNMYQQTFLVPRLVGPWQFKIFSVSTWLQLFTIPLQSTAFTCIFREEQWIWASVQGIIWTLVALYLLQFIATALLAVYWLKRWTGLVWDVRSIGDLIPMVSTSQGLESYEPMSLAPAHGFDILLADRQFDRLGYWHLGDNKRRQAVWYSIGTSSIDLDAIQRIVGKRNSKVPPPSPIRHLRNHKFDIDAHYIRWRYIAFPLWTRTLLSTMLLMSGIIAAILAVSFSKKTRLEDGFRPLMSARPGPGAFSAANFVYGFVPSLVGMLIFSMFQSIDHAVRVGQPWKQLCDMRGSRASKSLLADYAACHPFQSTWRAAQNGHWRVAVLSFFGVVFVFIPILAGGLFMALTNSFKEVRMFPNMPVFGILIAFLFLYLMCLWTLVLGRWHYRLPHPVTNLAHLISFITAEETLHNAAFRGVRSRADLKTRLGLHRDNPQEETVWYFGETAIGPRDGRFSIRPWNRFTEKVPRYSRTMRSPGF